MKRQYRWYIVPHLAALILGIVMVVLGYRQGEASIYGWVLVAGSILFALAYFGISRAEKAQNPGRRGSDDV